MKQNEEFGPLGPKVSEIMAALERIALGIIRCVEQFNQESAPPFSRRCASVAFGNAVYLSIKDPDSAETLLTWLQETGILGGRGAIIAAFSDFDDECNWIAGVGQLLSDLFPRPGGPDACPQLDRLVLFALGAGLVVARELPQVRSSIEVHWDELNSESRFLASLLINWSQSDWTPLYPPFVEYVAGFYEPGTHERRVMVEATRDVLAVAVAFSNPWSVGMWAEAGWYAGRKVGECMPGLLRELVAEVPPRELAAYVDLYRRCVLGTLTRDGTVQPERAALRYFGVTARDIYARALCTGDQPRFVARAAYDLTFWMGMLSTQAIPAP